MEMDLFIAIENHDLTALADLLHKGVNPNQYDAETQCSALHTAIYELDFGGKMESVDLLIHAGADVNCVDRGSVGTSPLIAAILENKPDVVHTLLVAGANPNIKNKFGDSPLRVCAEQNDLEIMIELLKHGATATINEAGGISGKTALGQAVANLNPAMVETLLRNGANPSALDINYQIADRYLPPDNQATNGAEREKIDLLLKHFRNDYRKTG